MAVQDFPCLPGHSTRSVNDDKIDGFFRARPAGRVAISALKRLFPGTEIKGILLKAIAYRVARERKCVLSNRSQHQEDCYDTNGEATVLFLTILQELRGWKSSVLGQDLEVDLDLQKGNPKRSLHLDALNNIQRSIIDCAWFDISPLLDDDRYLKNTRLEPSKHPDRHYFHKPKNGKGHYKCMWCNDYNAGVGHNDSDKCRSRSCGRVQKERPDYEKLKTALLALDSPKQFAESHREGDLTGEWVVWRQSRLTGPVAWRSLCDWEPTSKYEQIDIISQMLYYIHV